MPNGKPGDHPYTDIVIHGDSIFGPEIDGLIRDIHQRWGRVDEVAELAMQYDPRWGHAETDLSPLLMKLQQLKHHLESEQTPPKGAGFLNAILRFLRKPR